MNILEAQKQLAKARKKARDIREQITRLRESVIKAGGIAHHSGIDHFKRNKKIYRRWKTGQSAKEIAAAVNLSTQRTRQICQRIDKVLERGKGESFRKYKSLLKYYEMGKSETTQ